MTDDEFASRFAYTLGMMTALSKEMEGRRFVVEDFERRGVPLARFIQLADLCKEIGRAFYTEVKGEKE